ncbi:MAG: protein kinase [Leptolinea sp.]|jgi:hypothetical protein|nr:protein kinase [Leptolinea sp.]
MNAKVIIDVSGVKGKKRVFAYEDHDTFMVGRLDDCNVCIEDDDYLSRHHFILEVNPPHARLQDLGSLNGTYVNGRKVGGRDVDETPEEALTRHKYPWVDLKNGDVIETGDTHFTIIIQTPDQATGPVRCQKCGRVVTTEIGAFRGGTYICESCQKTAEASPFDLLQQFLADKSSMHKSVDEAKRVSQTGFSGEEPINFNDYDVIKTLGAGVFGATYLISHRPTGKHAALKLMLPKISVDDAVQERFLTETTEVHQLKHHNFLEFYESGCKNGIFYFVMEYCNVGNLEYLRRGGKVQPKFLILSTLQVLEALTYAHNEGHVHRNLKPQNILLNTLNNNLITKISDFGLSKSFISNGLSGMTVTGMTAGSYPYTPREQVLDFKYARPQTDIWALGATMYNLLTGEFPRNFSYSKDPLDVILNGEIIPVRARDPDIPTDIAEIIDHAVQNDPANRYQHAGEMLSALKRVWKRQK